MNQNSKMVRPSIWVACLFVCLSFNLAAFAQVRQSGKSSRPAVQTLPPAPAPTVRIYEPAPVTAPATTTVQTAPRAARQANTALEQVRAQRYVLRGLDGRAVELNQLLGNGRPVMVGFWQTACELSLAQVAYLNEAQERYATRGLTILALNLQDATQLNLVRSVAQQHRMSYPVYQTPIQLYAQLTNGRTGTPQWFIFDEAGNLAARLTGWSEAQGRRNFEQVLQVLMQP